MAITYNFYFFSSSYVSVSIPIFSIRSLSQPWLVRWVKQWEILEYYPAVDINALLAWFRSWDLLPQPQERGVKKLYKIFPSSLFFRLLLLQTLKILRGKQWSEILSHLETWVKHQESRELHIVDAFNTTLQYDNRQTGLREDDYPWWFLWFKLRLRWILQAPVIYILLSMIMKILLTGDRSLKLYTWYAVQTACSCRLMKIFIVEVRNLPVIRCVSSGQYPLQHD